MPGGLCLFGGAFNPPHRTHRRIAEAAIAQLSPERLIVLPCGDHPFKGDRRLAAAEHRLRMCELNFAGLPRVEVSRLELDRQGPSWTIDTIRHFRSEIGLEHPLYLLVGSDNLGQLDAWRDHHSILELADVVVFPRAGYPVDERALEGTDVRRKHKDEILSRALDTPADAVSSTAIRARIAQGLGPGDTDLWPDVAAYVREHGLYRETAG
jgi:nicotinate-nucleotide adenylyltransferase